MSTTAAAVVATTEAAEAAAAVAAAAGIPTSAFHPSAGATPIWVAPPRAPPIRTAQVLSVLPFASATYFLEWTCALVGNTRGMLVLFQPDLTALEDRRRAATTLGDRLERRVEGGECRAQNPSQ